jgi:hypothetical protein
MDRTNGSEQTTRTTLLSWIGTNPIRAIRTTELEAGGRNKKKPLREEGFLVFA